MKTIFRVLVLVFLVVDVISCATSQSHYSFFEASYPAKPEGCDVQILYKPPLKPFKYISRLDVHLEKTHFISSSLEDALPDLKNQACLSGADAIIDINENASMVGETKIFHVTAKGIRYLSK
ncbi:MAG: hypothetical protein NTW85_08815 [Methylococcales bacterium]|nr:hypothetical protein [Methylococcales bacterium]